MNRKYLYLSVGLFTVVTTGLVVDAQLQHPVIVDKIIRLVYPDWKQKDAEKQNEVQAGIKKPVTDMSSIPAIDRPDKDGIPPLVKAVTSTDNNAIDKLLKRGANIDVQDVTGNTPLNYAVYMGKDSAVNKLLMLGANPNIQDNDGMTPTAKASRMEMLSIAKLLLDRGADPDRQNNEGETPLILAAKYGYDDMINLLIKYNADVNRKDNLGRTALMEAAANGYTKSVVALLSMGADKNTRDSQGQTAQDYAFRFGHEDIALILQSDMEAHGASGNKPMQDIGLPPSLSENGALVPPPVSNEMPPKTAPFPTENQNTLNTPSAVKSGRTAQQTAPQTTLNNAGTGTAGQ